MDLNICPTLLLLKYNMRRCNVCVEGGARTWKSLLRARTKENSLPEIYHRKFSIISPQFSPTIYLLSIKLKEIKRRIFSFFLHSFSLILDWYSCFSNEMKWTLCVWQLHTHPKKTNNLLKLKSKHLDTSWTLTHTKSKWVLKVAFHSWPCSFTILLSEVFVLNSGVPQA